MAFCGRALEESAWMMCRGPVEVQGLRDYVSCSLATHDVDGKPPGASIGWQDSRCPCCKNDSCTSINYVIGSCLENKCVEFSPCASKLECAGTLRNQMTCEKVRHGCQETALSPDQNWWVHSDKIIALIDGLATRGVAILDNFLPNETFEGVLPVARTLSARHSTSTGFLSEIATSLLEGCFPPGHPLGGHLPVALFGPPGAARPDQALSCLRAQSGEVRRSWLQGENDELHHDFSRVTQAFDSLFVALQDQAIATSQQQIGDTPPAMLRTEVSKRLQTARFKDNLMVACHSGSPHAGPLHIDYDFDPVLCSRHCDWKGDSVLTVVLFLDPGGHLCIQNTHGDFNVSTAPNRALLYWSSASKHQIASSPTSSLSIVIRFFDGKRSLNTPPGLEHLYRHCNPVAPLTRFSALRLCAHDDNHAKRLELIHEFFEIHNGNKTDPSCLERWLGEAGYCTQCGRFLGSGWCSPSVEYGGRWVCRTCVLMWEHASSLEIRTQDGAAYSKLFVNDYQRQHVRLCIDDPAEWILELRHGALAPPETIQGWPCPLSALGECGDTNCVTYRFLTPGARPSFLRVAVNYVSHAMQSSPNGKRQIISFIGSGQLYFEFLLLDTLLCHGTRLQDVHVVDTSYGAPATWTAERNPLIAERASLAQFVAWFSQLHVFVHTSIESWADRIKPYREESLHAVVMVDVATLTGEWETSIRHTLEATLPRGSLFAHLTQSQDEEAVKGLEGVEAPRFAWAEIQQLRLVEGQLAFQRLERRQWELGATGPGLMTA